jgi:peroxiredoxin
MSGKKAKANRRGQRTQVVARKGRSWKLGLSGLAVAAVISASFVVPDQFSGSTAKAMGTGLAVGAAVPKFSEQNVATGTTISSRSLAGKRTLLFFSEGVMCQACFEQIKGLERLKGELGARDIRLVSVTPDSKAELNQAIGQYGIKTPMIADGNRDMSRAFNVLGQGMHGDTPGHAFVLVEGGKVLWYRDYWLAPTRTMYVPPERVLRDLPTS